MVLLTVAELVVGLFTGRLGEAWASVRALLGLLPRTPALLARRGAIAKIRRVGDAEILDLQNRGSARLTSFRRSRDTETYIGAETNVRRWRESSLAVTVAWIVVFVGIIVASRTLIDTRVPTVGEFLPLPDSARDLAGDYATAWNPGGLGNTVANPTGWMVLSLGSVLWLFRMGLGLTVLVVGLVVLGVWGTWRLATVYPTNRARITVLAVYAAIPLVPGIMSTGRLSALVAYAAVPWFVQLLRVAVGIGTADPAAASDDLVDGVIALSARERVRRTALLLVVTAVAIAMAPAVLLILLLVVLVLGLTTLAVGGGLRTAGWLVGLGLVALAGGWLLNLPWSLTWSWADLTAAPLAGPSGRGLVDTATMAIGQARFEVLALALYAPGARRPRHLPGVAVDVGRPSCRVGRRVPRAGRAAGPRRAAVRRARQRAAARPGGARPGAVGGVGGGLLQRRRHRADVRLAPATRRALRRRRRRRTVAGRPHRARRLLVPAAAEHRRARRGRTGRPRRGRRLSRALHR